MASAFTNKFWRKTYW